MYAKSIPFKDFNDKPRNETVRFNLTEPEVFKLLGEFQTVLKWYEAAKGVERELETAEVIDFYNAFEEILLSAYGVPSDDGLHFRKSGRYDFQESALFAACMVEFVTNPAETGKLIEAIMPKGMEEMVKKADANLAKVEGASTDAELRAEIALLRSKLASASDQ